MRTSIDLVDSGSGASIVIAINSALKDSELCCYPNAATGTGNAGKPESRPPRGDVNALRAHKANLEDLARALAKVTSRNESLMARQAAGTRTEDHYTIVAVSNGKRVVGIAARQKDAERRAREAGLLP